MQALERYSILCEYFCLLIQLSTHSSCFYLLCIELTRAFLVFKMYTQQSKYRIGHNFEEFIFHEYFNLLASCTSICCSMGCSGVWHMYTSEGVNNQDPLVSSCEQFIKGRLH